MTKIVRNRKQTGINHIVDILTEIISPIHDKKHPIDAVVKACYHGKYLEILKRTRQFT